MQRTRTQTSSSPSAPAGDPLAAERLTIGDDPHDLYELSLERGWGDGLPVLPPTEARVRELLDATPYHAEDVIGVLPPENREATIELAAINAAMAGCAPTGFPYVVAALEAMTAPEHNLYGLATTTGSVTSMLIVNGPSRDRAGIDYRDGCMGGAAGRGSSTIGRATSLCMRNIGGQAVGVSSKSVFGQPARAAGLCFAEWEERSPWSTVAEQLGHAREDDVITAHGGMGTMAIADINVDDAHELLRLIAKSVSFPLGNKFLSPTAGNGQMVIAINPIWAERFGAAIPDVEDVKAELHEHAWQPIDLWPADNQRILEEKGRVDDAGRVWLTERPDQFLLVVCGGLGNLHAVCLPSWADSELVSQAVVHAH